MDNAVEPLTIEVDFPVDDRPLSHGQPARSLGGLPLARAIPQDVHSIVDYATALAVGVAGFVAGTRRARIGCRVIGGVGLVQSLASDYRLSAVKLMPIELHEVRDYLWGAVNIAAPFALGYRKRERVASAVQFAAGAAVILAALFTDYRGWKRRYIGFLRRSES
jgi:hypothetical protein